MFLAEFLVVLLLVVLLFLRAGLLVHLGRPVIVVALFLPVTLVPLLLPRRLVPLLPRLMPERTGEGQS